MTAVELNPLMIRFVRHYGARAGGIYDRPDVEVVQAEARTFISRTDRRFDVIFMGFVDSWASVASGGLSLAENYLYTTQAFRAYYDHLTDEGELVVLRWDVDIPRLVANAIALLGVKEAARRIVVVLEKRGTPGGPAADDLHPAQAALHARGDRVGDERLDDGAARARAGPARRPAV